MRLTGDAALKFDTFSPLYNWIYPLSGEPSVRFSGSDAGRVLCEVPRARSRALYVHVPFCETICTFCPFVRGTVDDAGAVQAYVDALVREIHLKGKIKALTASPIGAVFFGGGTPSFLTPEQIVEVGTALRNSFDLSACREFSFEFEAKTATLERAQAARAIGVTHGRVGAQTFSPVYRRFFNLTATVEQVIAAAHLLRDTFPHASCDMLYAMHGQSEEDICLDVERACELGLENLDFYPINNLVTQPRLSREFRSAELTATSGLTKFYMGIFVRELLASHGYRPHNGHGFVQTEELDRGASSLTAHYSFVYHEHTLGYPEHDLLGFGVNAISSFRGSMVTNVASRTEYVRRLKRGELPVEVSEHSAEIDACRPLALALPYHGEIMSDWVDWDLVPQDVEQRLEMVIAHGLVAKTTRGFALTPCGLDWYSNLMYFLCPEAERKALSRVLRAGLQDPRRDVESAGVESFPFRRRLPMGLG